LGAILDTRLSWRTHVKTWAAKATRIGSHLKGLAGTQRGPPAGPLRTAVQACAVSVATYASEAWFPGTHSASGKPNRVKGLVDITNQAVVTACRAAIPAYRTTPSAAILREAGIPPAAVLLNRSRNRHAARIQLLDENHPLIHRVDDAPRTGRFESTLVCTAARVPQRPRLPLLPRAPALEMQDPEAGLNAITAASPSDVLLYTDGSRIDTGMVGFGFTAYRGENRVAIGHGALGSQCEVFDAELYAAAAGLAALLRHPDRSFWTRILVLLDNQAAVGRLASGVPTDRDRDCSASFFKTKSALEPELMPSLTLPTICVHWIPGHSGVQGNEEADTLAKMGAAAPAPDVPPIPPSPAFLKRWTAESAASESRVWWAATAPHSYRNLGIEFPTKAPPELSLPRPLLARLIAARSGHGDFADYHERFNHETANIFCSCGQRKSTTHFFFCRRARRAWDRADPASRGPPLGPRNSIDSLLSSHSGAKRFATFLTATSFFSTTSS
jgi:ribonuclease HI